MKLNNLLTKMYNKVNPTDIALIRESDIPQYLPVSFSLLKIKIDITIEQLTRPHKLLLFKIIGYLKSEIARETEHNCFIENIEKSNPVTEVTDELILRNEEEDEEAFFCSDMFNENLNENGKNPHNEIINNLNSLIDCQWELFELSILLRIDLASDTDFIDELFFFQVNDAIENSKELNLSKKIQAFCIKDQIKNFLIINHAAFVGFFNFNVDAFFEKHFKENAFIKAIVNQINIINDYHNLSQWLTKNTLDNLANSLFFVSFFFKESNLKINNQSAVEKAVFIIYRKQKLTERYIFSENDKENTVDHLEQIYPINIIEEIFSLEYSLDTLELRLDEPEEDTGAYFLLAKLARIYIKLYREPNGLESLYKKLGKQLPPFSQRPNSRAESLYDLVADPLVNYTQEDIDNITYINESIRKKQDINPAILQRYCVIQFRGICYTRPCFDEKTRIYNRESFSCSTYSKAVIEYAMEKYNNEHSDKISIGNFYTAEYPLEFEIYLEDAGELVKSRLAFLRTQGPIKVSLNGQITEHNNMLEALIAIYVSQYELFCEILKKYEQGNYAHIGSFKEILDQLRWGGDENKEELILKGVPFISTGDTPHHAVKYAGGLKQYEGHKPYRPLPKYDQNGDVLGAHTGNIYVSMHPLKEYLGDASPVNILALAKSNKILVDECVATERETTFLGYLKNKVIYQEAFRYPTLNKWDPSYLVKYGLNEKWFNNIKKSMMDLLAETNNDFHLGQLLDALVGIGKGQNLTRSEPIYENPNYNALTKFNETMVKLDTMLKPILFYLEMKLLKKAAAHAMTKGKKIIFRDHEGFFSTEIPHNILTTCKPTKDNELSKSMNNMEAFMDDVKIAKPHPQTLFFSFGENRSIIDRLIDSALSKRNLLKDLSSQPEFTITNFDLIAAKYDINSACMDDLEDINLDDLADIPLPSHEQWISPHSTDTDFDFLLSDEEEESDYDDTGEFMLELNIPQL